MINFLINKDLNAFHESNIIFTFRENNQYCLNGIDIKKAILKFNYIIITFSTGDTI